MSPLTLKGFQLFHKYFVRSKFSIHSVVVRPLLVPSNVAKPKQTDRTRWDLVEPVHHLFQNGAVLLSNCTSIFENLAIEEWMYRYYDFSVRNEFVLLVWTNESAVVIGRHQNIWSEVSINYCRDNMINVARRNSGGGTVYHDMQNLNLSFLTSRKCYDRKRNLLFLRDVLASTFSIDAELSPREDLVICGTGEKISGTASKLNSKNSYHHCTLLIDVNREALRNSLRRGHCPEIIHSNATKSVPSPVTNLHAINNEVNIDRLIEELKIQFPKYYTTEQVDISKSIEMNLFQSIDEIHDMFRSWNWIYGKTPKFTLKTKPILEQKEFNLIIERGLLKDCNEIVDNKQILELMQSTRFEYEDIKQLIERLQNIKSTENQNSIDKLILSLIHCYQTCVQ